MNLPVLDVAIGISFVYLLLSMICTTIGETIASWMKTRARFLDKGITRLLGGDENLKVQLYHHPMIVSLAEKDTAICPSYIPADKFATALLDLVSGAGKSMADAAALRAGVNGIQNEHLKGALTAILDKSHDDAALARLNVEHWFDENMDRVSGWYKRNAHTNALIIAVALTLILNADTLHMASLLWTTPTLRAAIVEQARARADKGRPEEALPLVDYADPTDPKDSPRPINVPGQAITSEERAALADLTGWRTDWKAFQDWKESKPGSSSPWGSIAGHLIGWTLTALALSLGAPFWFDTLNRFMNIRNAGRAPDERRDKTQPKTA